MIDTINRTTTRNVITVEDPIEFLHRDRLSFIHQREVGLDTQSFHDGLRYVLRQDPDIILVGEIRNLETMSTALMAADTGHLVMSTLHTTDVVQSIQRIISFYPPHQHDEIRLSLSANLRAVISQRLIPRRDGAGRVPSVEVMVSTPTIREYILNPDKLPLLHTVVGRGRHAVRHADLRPVGARAAARGTDHRGRGAPELQQPQRTQPQAQGHLGDQRPHLAVGRTRRRRRARPPRRRRAERRGHADWMSRE